MVAAMAAVGVKDPSAITAVLLYRIISLKGAVSLWAVMYSYIRASAKYFRRRPVASCPKDSSMAIGQEILTACPPPSRASPIICSHWTGSAEVTVRQLGSLPRAIGVGASPCPLWILSRNSRIR